MSVFRSGSLVDLRLADQRSVARQVYEKGRVKEYVFDPGEEETDTMLFVPAEGTSSLLTDPLASSKILPIICPDWKKKDTNDVGLMELFLENNSALSFPANRKDLIKEIPLQVPLIRALEHDFQANRYSYMYPLKHCRDYISQSPAVDSSDSLPKQLIEIDLVNSSFQDQFNFLEKICSFKDMHFHEFPIEFVPFSTHSINIPQSTYDSIVKDHKKMQGGGLQATTKEYSIKLDKDSASTPLLCRMSFGDGIRWTATVKLPWTPTPGDSDSISVPIGHLDPCNPVMTLLMGMKCLLGHTANLDRMLIMNTLSAMYGIEDKLPPALEIDALMLMNGSMFPVLSPFVNHYLVTGSVINDLSSSGDGKWHEELKSLPDELEVFITQGIRSAYCCGTILFTSLIRNLFPDSDCVCHTLGLTQPEWLMYFGGMVMEVCCNKIVHEDSRESLNPSRAAHMKCLYPFKDCTLKPYLSFKALNDDPNMAIFSELLPPWPGIINGGARSIHQVRFFFLKQYDVLKKLRYTHLSLYPDLFRLSSQNTYDMFEKEITFGQYYESSISLRTLTATTLEGLSQDKAFEHKQFMFDGTDFSSQALEREGQRVSRHIATGLLEFARTHPVMIFSILKYMRRTDPKSEAMRLYVKKPRIYERLRDMYRIIFAKPPPVVPAIEEIIDQRAGNTLSHLQRSELSTCKPGTDVLESERTNRRLRTLAAEKNVQSGKSRVDQQSKIIERYPALSKKERSARSVTRIRKGRSHSRSRHQAYRSRSREHQRSRSASKQQRGASLSRNLPTAISSAGPVVTFARDSDTRNISLGRAPSRSRKGLDHRSSDDNREFRSRKGLAYPSPDEYRDLRSRKGLDTWQDEDSRSRKGLDYRSYRSDTYRTSTGPREQYDRWEEDRRYRTGHGGHWDARSREGLATPEHRERSRYRSRSRSCSRYRPSRDNRWDQPLDRRYRY